MSQRSENFQLKRFVKILNFRSGSKDRGDDETTAQWSLPRSADNDLWRMTAVREKFRARERSAPQPNGGNLSMSEQSALSSQILA
jgi:hypothetical protein